MSVVVTMIKGDSQDGFVESRTKEWTANWELFTTKIDVHVSRVYNGFALLFRWKFAFTFVGPAPIFMQRVLEIFHQRRCVLMCSKCLLQIPSGCYSSSCSFYKGLISSLKQCKWKSRLISTIKRLLPTSLPPFRSPPHYTLCASWRGENKPHYDAKFWKSRVFPLKNASNVSSFSWLVWRVGLTVEIKLRIQIAPRLSVERALEYFTRVNKM